MVSVDEFLASHPEHKDSVDHDLTIARIQDEHAARQALDDQKSQLAKRKEALMKETNAKKEELSKLDAEIEKWIGGAETVRKLLDAHEKKSITVQDKEDSA